MLKQTLKPWSPKLRDPETRGCRNEFGMTEIKDFGQFGAVSKNPTPIQGDTDKTGVGSA
jgi:hypothetical protein